jgi:hypothetical protein
MIESSSTIAQNSAATKTTGTTTAIVDTIRQLAPQEEVEQRRKEQDELTREKREEDERIAVEEWVLGEERRVKEQARLQVEQERQELARQARLIRETQLRAQQSCSSS